MNCCQTRTECFQCVSDSPVFSAISLRLNRAFRTILTTTMSWNPVRTRFFNNSQPIPPAPTTKTRHALTICAVSSGKTPCILAAMVEINFFEFTCLTWLCTKIHRHTKGSCTECKENTTHTAGLFNNIPESNFLKHIHSILKAKKCLNYIICYLK